MRLWMQLRASRPALTRRSLPRRGRRHGGRRRGGIVAARERVSRSASKCSTGTGTSGAQRGLSEQVVMALSARSCGKQEKKANVAFLRRVIVRVRVTHSDEVRAVKHDTAVASRVPEFNCRHRVWVSLFPGSSREIQRGDVRALLVDLRLPVGSASQLDWWSAHQVP